MDTLCFKHELALSVAGLEQCSGVFLSVRRLREDHQRLRGTGGVSQENSALGFVPAFRDGATGLVYRSRYSDGRPAPMHVLDGLPAALIVQRTTSGQVTAVRSSVTAGFVKAGQFYTRAQAASALAGAKVSKG